MVDRRELSLGIMFTGHIDAALASSLGRLRTQMANMAGATTRTGTAAASATPKVRKMRDEFSNVGKQLSRVEGGVQRLLAAFKVVAAYGIAGTLTFGLIQGLRKGVDTIFEFDQALFNLKAIANASEADLQAMGNAIFDVAESTKFSASEVGDAMVLLAQAGFTAAESVDTIDSVAKLATGTLSDLKTSSDLLTTVIRAFGLEARDAGRVADVMANAVNQSKLTVDKLRVAFNFLGPVANKVGLSIEETAAAAGILANSGIRASTIGTGLRQVLARLKAPNEKLRESFVAAGVDLSKFTGDSLDMRDVMVELVKIVPNATKAFELFGLRGAPAVSALTEAGAEGFDKMYEKIIRAGEATRMAETQMEGLMVMAKNLADRLGTLAIRIGEGGIAGAFEVFIRAAREVVKVLSDLAETRFAQVIIGTATLSTVILALAASFRFLTFAASSLVAGLGSVILGAGYTVAIVKQMIVATNTATVAWTVFTTAVRAHPFFFLASAIALVIASIKIWTRHQQQVLLNMEAEEKAATKNVETLEGYKEQLSELTSGTKEYGAVLARLGAQFDEMKGYIDEGTRSWNDHGEALDELIQKEAEVALYRLVFQLKEYIGELDKLRKRELAFDIELPELVDLDAPDILNQTAKAAREVEIRIDRLGEIFHKLGFTAESRLSEIRAVLMEVFDEKIAVNQLEQMVAAVFSALLRIKHDIEGAVPGMKELLAEVPDFWVEHFKTLDAQGQGYFVQMLSRVDKEVTAFDKRSKELKLNEEQLGAARTAIRLRGLKDFIEKNFGEIKSEKEKREILIGLVDSFEDYKGTLLDKRLADIEEFTRRDIALAKQTATSEEEFEKAVAKITEEREKEKIAAKKKFAGEAAAIDSEGLRRRLADEREYQEEILRIRQRYSRLMATLETDPLKKLQAQYATRVDTIRVQHELELEKALGNQQKIEAADEKHNKAMLAAWKRFQFDKAKLEAEKTEETLKLEAAQMESRLERLRTDAADSFDTSKEFKLKELELEEQLLGKYLALAEKRLENTIRLYGENSTEAIKAAREREETIADIERNFGDQRRTGREIFLKGLQKDTQAYLDNRIIQMRISGATEEEIERTRWEHMAEYSESWLKRTRAGLGLATLDFREAARDWAGLVQDAANQMSSSLGEFFFRVIKDSGDLSEVWKDMLDAMLRYLVEFMAKKAVLDFLMLVGQLAAGAGAGGTGTGGQARGRELTAAGATVAHRGGEMGVDIMPRRFAPDWLFNLAPRLHSGLRPDEFPAILQRGEEVTPRGESGGGVRQINIFTPDTRTMSEWVRRNRGLFASATVDSIKDGDRGLIGAVRSVSRG